MDLLHEIPVPGVIGDEALEIPDFGDSGEIEGHRLDALSAEAGQESQGIELGVVPVVRVFEGRGEVLAEDREFSGQGRKVVFSQFLPLFEKVGGDMVGSGKDDPVGGPRRGREDPFLARLFGRFGRRGGAGSLGRLFWGSGAGFGRKPPSTRNSGSRTVT